MELIFFEPLYKYNVWGGYQISQKLKAMQKTKIGESWEISANEHGDCKIKNGEFKEKTLSEIFAIDKIRIDIFGEHCKKMKRFPILIKFIDADENLSVQVHPNNFYAKKLENGNGKKEMWYIMDCKEGNNIIYGFNDLVKTKKDLSNVNAENILNFLNYVPIKKGDAIFVNSGTIHSIMGGTLLCEIQQNSDITYRVYDWDRNNKSRPLHLKKAKQVINLKNKLKIKNMEETDEEVQKVFYNKYFKTDKIIVQAKTSFKSNPKSFQAINIIEGEGQVICNDKSVDIKKGDSFLVPAKLGEYIISGNLELLRTMC